MVSEESARQAARRGAKICTGFHPTDRVRRIFDAYRAEAMRVGTASGPEQFALRRQITIGLDDAAMRAAGRAREDQVRTQLLADPRLSAPGREAFDTPVSRAFTIGTDEFIAGAPASVAEQAVAQCREVGAGHFLASQGGARTTVQFVGDVRADGSACAAHSDGVAARESYSVNPPSTVIVWPVTIAAPNPRNNTTSARSSG